MKNSDTIIWYFSGKFQFLKTGANQKVPSYVEAGFTDVGLADPTFAAIKVIRPAMQRPDASIVQGCSADGKQMVKCLYTFIRPFIDLLDSYKIKIHYIAVVMRDSEIGYHIVTTTYSPLADDPPSQSGLEILRRARCGGRYISNAEVAIAMKAEKSKDIYSKTLLEADAKIADLIAGYKKIRDIAVRMCYPVLRIERTVTRAVVPAHAAPPPQPVGMDI